jgi:hypothetical protein
MTITVQVSPHVRTVDELRALAERLGVTLVPMHPGSSDPTLRRYYSVEVADPAAAERVATRLRESPVVAAAYIKPPDAMP